MSRDNRTREGQELQLQAHPSLNLQTPPIARAKQECASRSWKVQHILVLPVESVIDAERERQARSLSYIMKKLDASREIEFCVRRQVDDWRWELDEIEIRTLADITGNDGQAARTRPGPRQTGR